MPVLVHSILLARRVSHTRITTDLVFVPGVPPQYGLYNPSLAEWVETFDEATCVERLAAWPHVTRLPGQAILPYSQVMPAGEAWLAHES